MKPIFRIIWISLKWLLIALLCIEVFAFVLVTLSNLIIYGHAREGARVDYDPYCLFVEEEGVRPTTSNPPKDHGGELIRIWMFGGSTMEGATNDDSETILSIVASILNSRAVGKKYHVTNFGVASYNSILETKYLQKQLIENSDQPDIILFYDGANDSTYFNEFHNRYAHFGYRRIKAIIESYHYKWFGILKPVTAAINSSFTKEMIQKLTAVTTEMDPNDPELVQLAQDIEKRYEYINKISKCLNAGFIVIWQPMLWVETCKLDDNIREHERGFLLNRDKYSTIRKNIVTTYLRIMEKLKDKPYFINMRNALCERKRPAYKPDGVHLTDSGRVLVGEKIAELLKVKLNGQ